VTELRFDHQHLGIADRLGGKCVLVAGLSKPNMSPGKIERADLPPAIGEPPCNVRTVPLSTL
jgi:hypothetical protein